MSKGKYYTIGRTQFNISSVKKMSQSAFVKAYDSFLEDAEGAYKKIKEMKSSK